MRVHVLQHVPFEGLGSIEPWLRARHAAITTTRFFEESALPEPSSIDLLVALGGPMSVNDEAELPWLKQEKPFVRACVEAGLPVLGICLGAQLIASSFGERVYPNREREIGWLPIQAGAPSPGTFAFPGAIEVFHWHGETFDLPPSAAHLARSEGCENQAFQIGRRTIGLQFHLETTPASADAIITNCKNELIPARFVQSEERLRSAPTERYADINRLMDQVLGYITRRDD